MLPHMLPHCHVALFNFGNHTLTAALFLGALVGSVSHCAGMCGPFVIAQISGFSAPAGKNAGSWYRVLLLPYHAGRLTTYTLLGVLASALSAPVLHKPAFHIISSMLLVLAGTLFLASAFSQLVPSKYFNFNFNLCGTPTWIMQLIAPLLPSHSLLAGYVLGVLLGFLPCGLVYAAIMAVAATGNILAAAAGMIAFSAGTMPMLMVISLGGKMALKRQYVWLKPAMAILMVVNSMMLFIMAGRGFV